MSDQDKNPLSGLFDNFALGPAWAKQTSSDNTARERKYKDRFKDDDASPRRGPGGKGDFSGKSRNFRDRSNPREKSFERKPFIEPAQPERGVRVTILPSQHAVHLVGKEIHHVARVYSLYDVAQTLLSERDRCVAQFDVTEKHAPIFSSKLDAALFLTREEAVQHAWHTPLRAQLFDEETIEVDPPTGNFQSVAKCGLSGEWLGPPNFHTYQPTLRRIHRERFAHIPFESYSAKIITERGEEAVNAWLETMKTKVRWRLKGETSDDAWLDDPAAAQHLLATTHFAQCFEETRSTTVPGNISAKNLSPSLLTSLKHASKHVRHHPAILIPAVCRAIEAEHLPVFKRKGKLYTGPARPHPLPADAKLAERPGIMVEWIRANTPAKLQGLWQAVLPEGGTAPPAEFAADLFWLLTQGHILLFTDDTLVVQEIREPQPAAKKAKQKATPKTADEPNSTDEETPACEGPEPPVCDGPSCECQGPEAPECEGPHVEDSELHDIEKKIEENASTSIDDTAQL